MIDFACISGPDGTSLHLHNIQSNPAYGLSDCDYMIDFPDEISQKYFLNAFRFEAEDYQRLRRGDDWDKVLNTLGSGGPYKVSQETEDWWQEYTPKMQEACAERLFGKNPVWRIWSMTLNPVGVLIEYYHIRDTTMVGRVFVSISGIRCNVHVMPKNHDIREFIIEYSNNFSAGGRVGAMYTKIGQDRNVLGEFRFNGYMIGDNV